MRHFFFFKSKFLLVSYICIKIQDDYELVESLCKSDQQLKQAVENRGFTLDQISVDPWCAGYFSPEDAPERRLCKPMLFLKESQEDNIYGRPLEGIAITIDIGLGKVCVCLHKSLSLALSI